jgi:predicted TIM-barrel fold metal-dependent hydrolase
MVGQSAEEMIQVMDANGVDRSVLFTIKGFYRDMMTQGNDELAEVTRRHPDRFTGFGTVHPGMGQAALEEMDRCARIGLKGFKFQPVWQGFFVNTPAFHPIMEKLRELRLPVFIHSGTPPVSEPFQIINVAREYPDVPVILAHLGLPDFWEECVLAAKRIGNIYFETAGAQGLAIRTAVNTLGPERVIFGSDTPFGGPNNQYYQLENVRMSVPERYHDLVLGGNASRIIGISPRKA